MSPDERRLWLSWVIANALGELVGLGAVGAAGWAVFALGGAPAGLAGHVRAALALIAAGACEGVAVGFAQGAVLRRRVPAIALGLWTAATVAGALVAWVLGMIPSTLASAHAGAAASGTPPSIGPAVRLALAAALGFVLGPILALPQWRVLRGHTARAGRWVLANAVAWAAGMPVIFAGIGWTARHAATAPRPELVAVLLLVLAGAGAVVGAVHGLWLVALTRGR